ncbi:MAG: hypothetical protein AB9907_11050 [Flexilinea sp.]
MENEALEKFWDGILSREPAEILSVFLSVSLSDQRKCLEHLRKMVIEEGWHAEQVKSARIALGVLK